VRKHPDLKVCEVTPNAALRSVDVGEKVENARTVCWPSRKRIEVKQIIASVQPGGARFLLDGAITGVAQLPFVRVGRKEVGEKLGYALRIVAQDATQLLRFSLRGAA
jgi:hypothetical protein